MSEFKHNIDIEIGSEKNFGLVFAVAFAVIGLYPLFHSNPVRIWALVISIFSLSAALIRPTLLRVPNLLWHKLGLLLGAAVAPVAMGIVYFLTIAPIGLLMKLAGKDLLQGKPDSAKKSYWVKRDEPVGSMKNQF